jgi:hypothetical protein
MPCILKTPTYLRYLYRTFLITYILCRQMYTVLCNLVDLGGLVVSVLATGPKVRGFDPDRGRWIFKG